ncbi:hypothetical protein K2173_009543 [Erythroxylum novogranatense]|uniref:DUF7794 domain-containing protein n=1 Tax=Erythroxylum novogranatense TaxID=1862640 RepID=A0AAV8U471_9ROSI|nr:hypothetical protein K2173_009543 [Erythroxylum novogranatense]
MDFRFYFLVIVFLLHSVSHAETTGSVFFIDNKDRQYIRNPTTDESHSMSITEVGAAVSVLLGFSPSPTLSATSSSKLNEVLVPNPFDRPRAVFMLEVTGIKDPAQAIFRGAFRSKIVGSDKTNIELPGEEVSVVNLDEGLFDYNDREIDDFASSLGGSYVSNPSQPLKGELSLLLADGTTINLHMSKKADKEFISSLMALRFHSRRAISMHEDWSQSTNRPAELAMGTFTGLKALQDEYGPEAVLQQGLELLVATVSNVIEALQTVHKGQIVGVVFFTERPPLDSEKSFNIMLISSPSARWLAETKSSSNATNATVAEVVLVRKTLAWITGIILIISTLIGVYLLLNMPLTRDTLLYSNVKLD